MEQVRSSLVGTKQTYYRWQKKYGGMEFSQAKRLRQLEKENAKLKTLVANRALDMLIQRDAASGG